MTRGHSAATRPAANIVRIALLRRASRPRHFAAPVPMPAHEHPAIGIPPALRSPGQATAVHAGPRSCGDRQAGPARNGPAPKASERGPDGLPASRRP